MANARNEERINFRYNLKVYFSFIKKYKAAAIIILLLGFFIEASYAVDKFLFKIIVDKGTEFSASAVDKPSFINILILVLLIFSATLVLRSVGRFIHIHLLNNLESSVLTDLKRRFYNHIIHLSHKFHTSHKTGSLISRLIRGSGAIERMSDLIIFNVSPLLFQMIVVTASLAYFDLKSAVVVVATVICFVVYSIYIQDKQKESGFISTKKEDAEKAYISDTMTNIDPIKYFGKEEIIKNRFKKFTESTRKSYLKFWSYFRWLDLGQAFILGVGVFFLMYFPLKSFLAGEITVGSLVFIYTIYGNVTSPLFGFVHGIRNYYRSMTEFEALFRYEKISNDIKDKHDAKELVIKEGIIEFRNIGFRYGKRRIFENFNLKINKNEKIALVGYSGSGKTTLIKLLYRLYDPNEGEILIDGRDIRDFKQESLRSELSIVPQEGILFDDTIYSNIAFSKPGAGRKEVMAAMKFAQLDSITKSFPKKENTIVGERGIKLSGGEKQRVSIARAILANKRVLILDEATSHLDSKTEHDIQQDLKELMKDRTSIIIAHRLSTIMHADKIVVMEKGNIVQIGTHSQLIKSSGHYQKLWNLQKGGYIK